MIAYKATMKALLLILFILLGGWGYLLWHENAPLNQQHVDRIVKRCEQSSPVKNSFCQCYYTRAAQELSRRDLAVAMDVDQRARNAKEASIAKKHMPSCLREARFFYTQCTYDAGQKNVPPAKAEAFCGCLSQSIDPKLDALMNEVERKVLNENMTVEFASRQTWQQYYYNSWTSCLGTLR